MGPDFLSPGFVGHVDLDRGRRFMATIVRSEEQLARLEGFQEGLGVSLVPAGGAEGGRIGARAAWPRGVARKEPDGTGREAVSSEWSVGDRSGFLGNQAGTYRESDQARYVKDVEPLHQLHPVVFDSLRAQP